MNLLSWFALSIYSPALFAVVNHLDTHIICNKLKNHSGMPLYTTSTAFIMSLIAFICAGFPLLGRAGLILSVSGFLAMMAYALYYKAIASGDTSLIAALIQVSSVFTLVLSILFLHEHLSLSRWVGFFLILGAACALSIESSSGKLKLGKAFWPIILADLFWAIGWIVLKQAFTVKTFLPIMAYEGFGVTLGGLVLACNPGIRSAFISSFSEVGRPVIALVVATEAIGITAKMIGFLAVSLGPVAIVSALSGVQPFFTLLYGYILAGFFPKLFQSQKTGRLLVQQISLTATLFIGVWLCR